MEIFFMGTSLVSICAPKGLRIYYRNCESCRARITPRLSLKSVPPLAFPIVGKPEINGKRVAILRSEY